MPRHGHVPMREVHDQGVGQIGVPTPSSKPTSFPGYKETHDWVKYFKDRADFLEKHPHLAAAVLPSLSLRERALIKFIPRFNYWQSASPAEYQILCAAVGTDEPLKVAQYYADAYLRLEQTKELVNTIDLSQNPLARPQVGLLSGLRSGTIISGTAPQGAANGVDPGLLFGGTGTTR